MSKLDEITVRFDDFEDIRHVLGACLNYFTARDLGQAQIDLKISYKSPLTQEIARVHERVSGYIADFLLAKYESEHGVIQDEEQEEEPKEEPKTKSRHNKSEE